MQGTYIIREFRAADTESWLRCRLLSFFRTDYFDDIVTERTRYVRPALCHVAVVGEEVVGLMDIQLQDHGATIEVLAIHPDHARQGLATALLREAEPWLSEHKVYELDAWTREDVAANQWYQRSGFVEVFAYLHVYKSYEDDAAGFATPEGLSLPVSAALHAPMELEEEMRQRFRRVYRCRRYVLRLEGDR